MAKDPVLPLYYNDITTSTQDWSDEEFGAYMRLLIHQWRNGFLPNDYQRLTRIATSLDSTWELIKCKFVEEDGVLKNRNMEEIREKRNKHKEKQRLNVLNRYQKTTKNLPLESEKENEYEKEVELESEIEVKLYPQFSDFWNLYDKKLDRPKTELKWGRLSQKDKEAIMAYLPEYIANTQDKQYRKNPTTFLNNRSWENEIIPKNGNSATNTIDKHSKLKNLQKAARTIYSPDQGNQP